MRNRPSSRKYYFALATLFALPCACLAQTTNIKLGTLLPQGTSQYQALERMGQKWKKATSGAATLTIYGGGQMGTEAESIQKVRIGQLQAVTLSAAGMANIDPYLGAAEKVPMLFHSLGEAEYVRNKLAPEVEQRLEKKGFVVLFWSDAGWIQVFSRSPILRPADLKHTKLLTTPGDPVEVDLIRSLEITPVERSWAEALGSLKTGAVDTLVTTPFLCLAGQFDTTAKHYLPLNYVPLAGATVISKRTWDTLNAKQQEAMLEAAVEAGKQIQASSREENVTSIDAMRGRGLQVHAMTPEAEKEWQAYFAAVYPRVRGKLVPAEIFDEVQGLLAEYRKNGAAGMKGAGNEQR
jgi:TRAP-type C4-dicarboxylate transport system substrate-binding protein